MKSHHFKQLIKGVKEMRALMAGEHIAGIQISTLNSLNACNPNQGSSLDDYLKKELINEAVHTKALNRAVKGQQIVTQEAT